MDQAERLRNVIKVRNQARLDRGSVITITSGKGGVGKSNTAVNLAVWLTKLGKKVIIFDADFGLANVEVMFGTVPRYNLSDLIYGSKSIQEIITVGPLGIGFISGGSGIVSLNNLTSDQISYMIQSLSSLNEMCDVLIIDTGAGVTDQVLEFVMASPEVLLVSTPEPSSITDSYSLMKAMFLDQRFNSSETRIRIIANKVQSSQEARQLYNKLSNVVRQFLHGNTEYLGMIPFDLSLEKAVRAQKIVSLENPTSKAALAYREIAEKLTGSDEEARSKWGISRFFSHFIRR